MQCNPQMANLSNIRLQSHNKPFSNTDVDYFRPIQAKTSRKTRRNQGTLKTYGVILTYIYIYKICCTKIECQHYVI